MIAIGFYYIVRLISKYVLVICLYLALTNVAHAKPEQFTLAYLKTGLSELTDTNRRVGLKLLVNELIQDDTVRQTIQPVDSLAGLQHLIIRSDVDYIFINSYHYISHYDFFKQHLKQPIWAIQRGTERRENYIIVTRKRYAGQSLHQLRGKNISLYQPYLLVKLYLDYLIKQSDNQNSTQFFSKIKYTKTASQPILDVFFGKSDLCIVQQHIFDLAVDLNPAILKELTIIHESGHLFFPALAFSLKQADSLYITTVNQGLSNFEENIRGEQILEMLGLHKIIPIQAEQLQPMYHIYQAFHGLDAQ
ncbi:MAG: hypothetical protein methR_P3822 [Methyloprofundus sp.]|nr:MAG: hypothetical protein methR_P3822 [Methyloprofundus sp.]